jgi:hypothetical protein
MTVVLDTFIDPVSKETFIDGTYNKISVIANENDGYVNAKKMAAAWGKEIKEYFRLKDWKNKVKYWSKEINTESKARYTLKKGYGNRARGDYVHPDFVHFVAEWCNVDYAFKVAKIMDAINSGNNEELGIRVRELRERNEILETKKQELECEITGLVARKTALQSEIFETSVRTDSRRKMVRILEYDNHIHVSIDQSKNIHDGILLALFVYPTHRNIVDKLRNEWGITGTRCPCFNYEDLDDLIEWFKGYKPIEQHYF